MQSYLNHSVATAIIEDRRRAAGARAQKPPRGARPPGRVRRSAASAAIRIAHRLDADTAHRTISA